MLIRISLIIAIVAGLAAAGISFTQVKGKIEQVKTERNEWHDKFTTTDGELKSTKSELAKTEKELKDTKTELTGAQEERDKAVAEAASQVKRATQLKTDLDKTRSERDNAQAELAAWGALGIPVDQVKQVIAQAKLLSEERDVLQAEKKVLMTANGRLENELKRYRDPEYVVRLPSKLRGTVLVADPKWDFVILSVGEDQGVLEHGELLVHRDGKLVAKVVVRGVQKDRCVANIVAGYRSDTITITEGDLVIPAHPAS